MRQFKLNSLKFFPDSEKIQDFMTFPGSLEFHEISRFPDRVATPLNRELLCEM